MSRFHHRSPRLRYLRARLLIFTRPSFLAAVVFLACLGFVVKEYWTNPNFLKFNQSQEASSRTPSSPQFLLSDEDKAIAADIGNLSVLDYDQQQANTPITTNIKDGKQIRQQEEAQLNKILDIAQKNQKVNQIQPNTTKSQTSATRSVSLQNPFLKQAENLLKFNSDRGNTNANANNLSPFPTTQTPGDSFNLGIDNSRSANSESALQKAINESNNKKNQEDTSTDEKAFGESLQNDKKAASPNSSTNQKLLQNQTDSLVNTNLFNQPLNNQSQNPNANNNNQFPANNFNNYTQPGLNNQSQPNNYAQPGLNNQAQPYGNFNNNQFPANNNTQPGLNNQFQNPYGNNNTQAPRNYTQPIPYNNFNNNPQQNPYSNFNRNQVPTNNQVQNPYNNFNNNQLRVNGSPQTQTRINNIYNKLINREFPSAANRNTFTAPNNNINTGVQREHPNFAN